MFFVKETETAWRVWLKTFYGHCRSTFYDCTWRFLHWLAFEVRLFTRNVAWVFPWASQRHGMDRDCADRSPIDQSGCPFNRSRTRFHAFLANHNLPPSAEPLKMFSQVLRANHLWLRSVSNRFQLRIPGLAQSVSHTCSRYVYRWE